MKKLAIMFVMLLGSVATMQAQSFDFSCESSSELDLPFDVNQDALFSAEQVTALEWAELSQGHQNLGPGEDYYDINHYASTFYRAGQTAADCPRCNPTQVSIDVQLTNEVLEYTVTRNDRILDRSEFGGIRDYDNFRSAHEAILAIILSL